MVETLFIAWIASAGHSNLSGTVWQDLLKLVAAIPADADAGPPVFAVALVAASRAWPKVPVAEIRPLDIGLAGALLTFFIACEWVELPAHSPLHDRLGHDPAGVAAGVAPPRVPRRIDRPADRRALEERLHGLGPMHTSRCSTWTTSRNSTTPTATTSATRCSRLVAARLAQATGGGTAYRYGGEEFCIMFPARSGWPRRCRTSKSIRAYIAAYQMAVRRDDRPKDAEAGTRLRSLRVAEKTLSVTVSIGIAEPDDQRSTPAEVLRAADQALYRAKQGGRNRVSR